MKETINNIKKLIEERNKISSTRKTRKNKGYDILCGRQTTVHHDLIKEVEKLLEMIKPAD